MTTRFGELMGIKDLPQTYDGYERLLVDYETERFEFDPANRRVTEASIDIARELAPLPDEAGHPAPHDRADGRAAAGRPRDAEAAGLVRPRGQGWSAAPGAGAADLPAAAQAYHHKPSTYPMGYRLGDLGPASMLDELNGTGQPARERLITAFAARWKPVTTASSVSWRSRAIVRSSFSASSGECGSRR